MTTEVENGQEATPEKTDSSVTALPIEKKEEGPDEGKIALPFEFRQIDFRGVRSRRNRLRR